MTDHNTNTPCNCHLHEGRSEYCAVHRGTTPSTGGDNEPTLVRYADAPHCDMCECRHCGAQYATESPSLESKKRCGTVGLDLRERCGLPEGHNGPCCYFPSPSPESKTGSGEAVEAQATRHCLGSLCITGPSDPCLCQCSWCLPPKPALVNTAQNMAGEIADLKRQLAEMQKTIDRHRKMDFCAKCGHACVQLGSDDQVYDGECLCRLNALEDECDTLRTENDRLRGEVKAWRIRQALPDDLHQFWSSAFLGIVDERDQARAVLAKANERIAELERELDEKSERHSARMATSREALVMAQVRADNAEAQLAQAVAEKEAAERREALQARIAAQAEIDRDKAEANLRVAREALAYAACVFEQYASLHQQKGTGAGDIKAASNSKHAKRLRAALASTPTKPGEGE